MNNENVYDDTIARIYVNYVDGCYKKHGGTVLPTLHTSTITKLKGKYFADLRAGSMHLARYFVSGNERRRLTPLDHEYVHKETPNDANHERFIILAIIAYERWCQKIGIPFVPPSLSESRVNTTMGEKVIELFDGTSQLLAQYDWNDGQLQYLPFVSTVHDDFQLDEFYDED